MLNIVLNDYKINIYVYFDLFSEKIKFIVSEEDDEFTDAIETTSNGLFSRDNLDINRLTKQPTHLR